MLILLAQAAAPQETIRGLGAWSKLLIGCGCVSVIVLVTLAVGIAIIIAGRRRE